MKVLVLFFVVRHKISTNLLYAKAIEDENSKVDYTYQKQFISYKQLKEHLFSKNNHSYFRDTEDIRADLRDFKVNSGFHLTARAKDMPSIGDIVVSIEQHQIEIN